MPASRPKFDVWDPSLGFIRTIYADNAEKAAEQFCDFQYYGGNKESEYYVKVRDSADVVTNFTVEVRVEFDVYKEPS